jgi:hypothetical protein
LQITDVLNELIRAQSRASNAVTRIGDEESEDIEPSWKR